MKQLSVIIPAYNMEKYIRRCLDSVLTPGVLEDVEVIVVNDGSTDSTLSIAESIREAYPRSVITVNKPNGNYGSAVNAGLRAASGRYVKLLDADDTFNSRDFESLVRTLETLDTDVVCTHFTAIHRHVKEKNKYDVLNREIYRYGEQYLLDDILSDGIIRFFLMHSLTYRRSMLVDHGYRQSEGLSYTDNEWATIPFFYARDIVFLNLDVYQYDACRTGQTMNPGVLMSSRRQLCTVTDGLVNYFSNYDRTLLSENRIRFLRCCLVNKIHFIYRIYLLDMPRKQFDKKEFDEIFARYESFCDREDIGNEFRRLFKKPLILYARNPVTRTDLISNWKRLHDRLPLWLEQLNRMLDSVTLGIYRLFVRR